MVMMIYKKLDDKGVRKLELDSFVLILSKESFVPVVA